MNNIFHYHKFKNLSKNWKKYVFHWKKMNFEDIGNSVYTAEFLALEIDLNNYMDYLVLYQSRQHVQ